jgi:hypothetical protein
MIGHDRHAQIDGSFDVGAFGIAPAFRAGGACAAAFAALYPR